jgi:multidrug resistance efflux pump
MRSPVENWLHFLKRSKLLIFFILILVVGYGLYFFVYFYPITNNAFVVAKYRPVAAQVSGYIEHVYVKNGENVKKGQLLFEINDEPYQYKVEQITNQLAADNEELESIKQDIVINEDKYKITKDMLDLAQENSSAATELAKNGAMANLMKDKYTTKYQEITSQLHEIQGIIKQKKIKERQQKYIIQQTAAALKTAQYDLSETKAYAQSDGIVSNLFLSEGSPVKALVPLFSFVDTSEWWVQANFKETDIPEGIRPGVKANIRLKMYLGDKVYKGVVTSINWAVSRQRLDEHSMMQSVPSENEWVLLPQRFPVMIKILDPDPKYPLNVGASAYVTLQE